MTKTVLVTGGAGFVGSHLCERLREQGDKVVCIDNFSSGSIRNLALVKEKIEIIKADVNREQEIKPIFKKYKIDMIFHHAFTVGVQRTLEKPLKVLNDIRGIVNLLELARKHNTEKILFASSSEVYGEPVEIPEIETGHVNPKLPYAVAKLMGEKYIEAYHSTYGMRGTSLRLFNVYGPRQESSSYGFVVGIFIKQAMANKNPTIFGDGTQTRDFVFIDDNISATLEAMNSKKTDGKVINIGTGKPTTILDLAESIIKLCKKKKLKPVFLQNSREDVKHRFPNISLMRKVLKYRPEIGLDEGLKRTIDWYKPQYK